MYEDEEGAHKAEQGEEEEEEQGEFWRSSGRGIEVYASKSIT